MRPFDDSCTLLVQLFAMFYTCVGCQRLLTTCGDDIVDCLPLTGPKRRSTDGKPKRCSPVTCLRVTALLVLSTVLLVLLLSFRNPATQVLTLALLTIWQLLWRQTFCVCRRTRNLTDLVLAYEPF